MNVSYSHTKYQLKTWTKSVFFGCFLLMVYARSYIARKYDRKYDLPPSALFPLLFLFSSFSSFSFSSPSFPSHYIFMPTQANSCFLHKMTASSQGSIQLFCVPLGKNHVLLSDKNTYRRNRSENPSKRVGVIIYLTEAHVQSATWKYCH